MVVYLCKLFVVLRVHSELVSVLALRPDQCLLSSVGAGSLVQKVHVRLKIGHDFYTLSLLPS